MFALFFRAWVVVVRNIHLIPDSLKNTSIPLEPSNAELPKLVFYIIRRRYNCTPGPRSQFVLGCLNWNAFSSAFPGFWDWLKASAAQQHQTALSDSICRSLYMHADNFYFFLFANQYQWATSWYKVKTSHWRTLGVFFFFFVPGELYAEGCVVGFILFFPLLLLYAEAATLGAAERAPCISCALPGASVQSSTWGLASSLSASLFCKWRWTEGRGVGGLEVEGVIRCCRDSVVLLGSAARSNRIPPPFFFFFPAAAFESSSSTPNYCISQSMQSLDSSELGHCLMCHSVRIWRALMKRLLRMGKVHFCDATFWNAVLLAQGCSSLKNKLLSERLNVVRLLF